jgi:SAM-dependent methyltransferase
MKSGLGSAVFALKYRPIRKHLKARQRFLSPSGRERLTESLTKHYFTGSSVGYFPVGYLDTEEGQKNLAGHVHLAIDEERWTIVPWLDSLFRLDGSKIIEVGCGTGTSSVALAEQGAELISYDVDLPSLKVGEERFAVYNLKPDLRHANASEIPATEISQASAVIFSASVEHMTLDEKLESFSLVWNSLRRGGYLIVLDLPNRLWWFDRHTAMLPFYLWLPDDLAVHYSRFSPRFPFKDQLRPPVTNQTLLKLTRIGRAASYHEFELALGDLSQLQVSSLNRWKRGNPLQFAKWFVKERSFQRWLQNRGPRIDRAFYEPQLKLAIRKP